MLHRGFGRREITWVQTGFFRCADGFPVWKGVKLQGSQTSKKSRSAVRKQNCMVLKHILYGKSNQPTLKKSKIVWFLNKQGPIFLRTFLLERHKEIVGALVLTLSRGR